MFGRKLKSRLDLLRPNTNKLLATNVEEQSKYYKGSNQKQFEVGEPVSIREYRNPTSPRWEEREVVSRKSNV